MKRRNMSREDAEARMSSQLTQDEYKALAHEVIVNNGSKEEDLEKNVKRIIQQVIS